MQIVPPSSAWRTRLSTALQSPSAPLKLFPVALTLIASLLAYNPRWMDSALSLYLGLLFVFFMPGYLLEQILSLTNHDWTLARVPHWFVLSLAVWALPATGLQWLGASWATFRVIFVLILWALTLVTTLRRFSSPLPMGEGDASSRNTIADDDLRMRRDDTSGLGVRFRSLAPELLLLALGIAAALLTVSSPRDGDDWTYLIVVQKLANQPQFHLIAENEDRYSLRYLFHIWFFAQAFLKEWLNADLVTLVREILPALLAPLAVWSFYGWARTFFKARGAALLAVGIQAAILITFTYGEGWGRGLFVRIAQDKFMVWLIVIPIALQWLWQWLTRGNTRHLLGYGASLIAALWIHPVVLFIQAIGVAGLGLLNQISRIPFPRARWLWLALVSAPVLATPLVVRATTDYTIFPVDAPGSETYIRIARDRLLFQPPFYSANPDLLAHPLVLFSLAVLILLAPRLRTSPRVQFLLGSTLVPLALVFNPYTARVWGELFTPWQLWRFTWTVPAALILTEGILQFIPLLRVPQWWRTPRGAFTFALLLVALLASIAASDVDIPRSLAVLTRGHALNSNLEEMLRLMQRDLEQPALVLVPREFTRLPPAYTPNARVLTTAVELPKGSEGTELDQFYRDKGNAAALNEFLKAWKIEYVLVENTSRQDEYLDTRAEWNLVRRNETYALYKRLETRY